MTLVWSFHLRFNFFVCKIQPPEDIASVLFFKIFDITSVVAGTMLEQGKAL